MGLGVYLFIQVKATPAQAEPPATATTSTRATTPVPERSDGIRQPAAVEASRTARANPEQPVAHTTTAPADPDVTAAEDERRANPRFDSMMELANKAYDAQDFDQATAIATKVLAKDPTNVRMLRIMVSANCIAGDASIAQQHYVKLPQADRDQMKVRCDRYQVTLEDP